MKQISLRKQLLLVVAAATFGTTAYAQVTESTDQPARTTETPTPPTQATTPLDDRKIEQFADAYVAVQTIQSKAAQELSATTDPAKQQQKQQAVESEMIAAVEKTGLKIDEFNGIVQNLSADADLRARVVAEIRERTGG